MAHKNKQGLKRKLIECKRCGRCCIVYDKTTDSWKDCPYLVRYFDGRTFCSIYRNRYGAIVGENQICKKREQIKYSYPDCPYNCGYDLHPAYKKNEVERLRG